MTQDNQDNFIAEVTDSLIAVLNHLMMGHSFGIGVSKKVRDYLLPPVQSCSVVNTMKYTSDRDSDWELPDHDWQVHINYKLADTSGNTDDLVGLNLIEQHLQLRDSVIKSLNDYLAMMNYANVRIDYVPAITVDMTSNFGSSFDFVVIDTVKRQVNVARTLAEQPKLLKWYVQGTVLHSVQGDLWQIVNAHTRISEPYEDVTTNRPVLDLKLVGLNPEHTSAINWSNKLDRGCYRLDVLTSEVLTYEP